MYCYYWLTIIKDFINYAKGCQDCEKHDPIQHVLAGLMNLIIKGWCFKGWAMHVIGQISPKYILVATDFFTKWVEVVPYKKVT